MQNEPEKREYSLIDHKSRKIPFCSWIPASPESQIILVHGYSEHLRYYRSFAKKCCQKRIAVHTMDLPGHGTAEGTRGHIEDFQDYIDNVDLLFKSNPNFQKVPTYLFGHSLGGLIASYYCIWYKPQINGLIFTSPLFGFPVSTLPAIYLAKIVIKRYADTLFPKPCLVHRLTRNIDNRPMYRNDPYRVFCISPKLLLLMHEYGGKIQDRAADLQTPVLLFMSGKDRVVSLPAIRKFFMKCGTKDKTLVAFSEAMHELIQEEENIQILNKMASWIAERN